MVASLAGDDFLACLLQVAWGAEGLESVPCVGVGGAGVDEVYAWGDVVGDCGGVAACGAGGVGSEEACAGECPCAAVSAFAGGGALCFEGVPSSAFPEGFAGVALSGVAGLLVASAAVVGGAWWHVTLPPFTCVAVMVRVSRLMSRS